MQTQVDVPLLICRPYKIVDLQFFYVITNSLHIVYKIAKKRNLFAAFFRVGPSIKNSFSLCQNKANGDTYGNTHDNADEYLPDVAAFA